MPTFSPLHPPDLRLSRLALHPDTLSALTDANLLLPDLLLPPASHVPPQHFLSARHALLATLAPCPQQHARTRPLPTPLPALSDVLGSDGRSVVAQVAGRPATGKTLLAVYTAAEMLKQGQTVVWLETTASVHELNGRFEALVGADCVKEGLLILAVKNAQHCIAVLQALQHDLNKLKVIPADARTADMEKITSARMLVLDSLAVLIAPILGQHSGSWSGHAALNCVAVLLRALATQMNAVVLVTNRVVATEHAVKPALGYLWASFVDVTIMLRQTIERDEVDERENEEERGFSASVMSKRNAPMTFSFRVDQHGLHQHHHQHPPTPHPS